MIDFDQGAFELIYTIAIRDAYANMGNNSSFLFSSGTGALRHINLDTDYGEVSGTNNLMVNVTSAQAWNWRVNKLQMHSFLGAGLTTSPYNFTGGFFDSEAMIDSEGAASGYSFAQLNSFSCIGSVLHLGQENPTTSCNNAAIIAGVTIGTGEINSQIINAGTSLQFQGVSGISGTFHFGTCTVVFQGGIPTSTSGAC